MPFVKLFSSLLTSTIWKEDNDTRLVWITLLVMADEHGHIEASIPGLADMAHVPLEACEAALKKLMAPDKYSRTKTNEGRRIAEIDGGWKLLNYDKYRAKLSREERREYQREYWHKRKDSTALNTTQQDSTKSTQAEAEAEAEAEERAATPPPPPLSGPEGNPESIGFLVNAFSFCTSPGPQSKRDALQDLIRQGLTPQELTTYANNPAFRTWDFWGIIRQIRKDHFQQLVTQQPDVDAIVKKVFDEKRLKGNTRGNI